MPTALVLLLGWERPGAAVHDFIECKRASGIRVTARMAIDHLTE